MPDPTLQGTALRYAAGDLPAPEAAAFEARLAADQDARDALGEAVRLSAAALGQEPPAPHPVVRDVVRARVAPRRAARHPLAWVAAGAAAVACVLVGLSRADRAGPPAVSQAPPAAVAPVSHEVAPPPPAADPVADGVAPPPPAADPVADGAARHDAEDGHAASEAPRSVAEVWADLSTPDHVEKARDEELRWRQRVRDMAPTHHPAPRPSGGGTNVRE